MWHNPKLLNTITNVLLLLSMLALLAAGLWWLAQRPMFGLKTITVRGVGNAELRHANAVTIRNAALPRIQGNFFTVDLDAVRAAFESVPWVRRAAVRRAWPNGLQVELEEYRVLGSWGEDGQLLSTRGDVFTANLAEAEEEGLQLSFHGPKGYEKEVARRYAEMRDWLAPISLAPIMVSLSERFAWTVQLNNGTTVKLGREEEGRTLKTLMARLTRAYPQLAAGIEGQIQRVDLRYPNGLALAVSGAGVGRKGYNSKRGI